MGIMLRHERGANDLQVGKHFACKLDKPAVLIFDPNGNDKLGNDAISSVQLNFLLHIRGKHIALQAK